MKMIFEKSISCTNVEAEVNKTLALKWLETFQSLILWKSIS